MKQILLLFCCAAAYGQTQARINQITGEATGDARVWVQGEDGRMIAARIDAATLEIVPAATPSQPPVLRAKIQAAAAVIEMWTPTKATTAQQAWTLPAVPRFVMLFRNGVLQRDGEDYDRIGTLITFRQGVVQVGDLVSAAFQR